MAQQDAEVGGEDESAETDDILTQVNEHEKELLIGQTIKNVREMTDEEMEHEGWGKAHGIRPAAIELENGVVVYPSQDSEGNGGGALFGTNDNEMFWVTP